MATRAEVDEYESVIHGLSTVAFAQIKSLLQTIDDPNPIVFRDALLEAYPELMAPFLATAGEVAAEWYTDLRGKVGLKAPFTPKPAPAPPTAELDADVRYSLKPLFAPAGEFIGSEILSLLAGFTQKLIAGQGRQTIESSAFADPARVGWARIPQPGCCAFCALLASRGAVYSSAETAGLGNAYHKFCRCVPVPVFPGGDNALALRTEEHFGDLYADLESATGQRPVGAAVNVTEVLADWRHTHGTK